MAATNPYQVMPPLSPEEYEALCDDIAENGVLVPVVKDQQGAVLDGHHRIAIADELGIDYRVDVVVVEDEAHARSLARRYNLARRHLSTAQKRELIAAEVEADPDRSDREIARLIGVDHKTVGSVRRASRGEFPHAKPEPPTELQLAEQLVTAICLRYEQAETDEERELWVTPLYLTDAIVEWASTEVPNVYWFGAVASKMFALDVAYEAWELMAPWMVAVAKLSLEECAEVRRERNAPDWRFPTERLAEITVAWWEPDVSREMRETVRRSLDMQVVVALAECDPIWPIPTRGLPHREDYWLGHAAEVLAYVARERAETASTTDGGS